MSTYQVPNTALTIQIAKASLCYAGRDIQRKNFRQNPINLNLKKQLWVSSETLDWANSNTDLVDSSTLRILRNYTLGLCGNYVVEALSSIGSGGVIITPTNATPLGFTGYREDFTIGQPGSLMNDGDVSLTISLPGFIPKTVMMFPSGINATIDDTDTGSFDIDSIVYTSTSVTITLSYPVHDGQRYIITGLRYAAAVTPSGGGTVLPIQDGHEGQILFTDGAGNLYWADAHIDYVSADFEADGITVNDTRLDHNTFDLYLNQLGRYLTETEFVRINGGGFTITLDGFDANANEYNLYAELKGLNE